MTQQAARLAPHRYLAWLFSCLIVGEIGLAALNVAVDPYDMFGLVSVPGLNAEKTRRLGGGGRVERSMRLWLNDYETIILGSSRTQVGFDPASPLLAPLKAYNASLSGTSMAELYEVGHFILQQQKPKRLVFGIDFFMFSNDREHGNGDFRYSGFAGTKMPFALLYRLCSMVGFADSIRTVADNIAGRQAVDRADGFVADPGSPNGYSPRQIFDRILGKLLIDPDNYGDYDYDLDRLNKLKALLAEYTQSGVEVNLFITPTHVWNLEAVHALGLYEVFERWIRDVTAIVADVNGQSADPRKIRLWDFSGYNAINMEPVQRHGDARSMAFWWDMSHFKAPVGDKIAARILCPGVSCASAADGFGALLTPTTVDSVLAAKRAARQVYLHNEPFDPVHVARMTATTEPARRHLSSKGADNG